MQAYIAAMPGWKSDLGRRLDALVVRTVPGVRKAVKWNSPFYGVEDGTWFLSFHCFTKYVKVTFFRGTSLHPVRPGQSKHPEVRYLDIREDDCSTKPASPHGSSRPAACPASGSDRPARVRHRLPVASGAVGAAGPRSRHRIASTNNAKAGAGWRRLG